MEIATFTHDDIDPFLRLAAEEGWLCGRDEFRFLLDSYPQGSFVAQVRGGEPRGFITSIAYQKSGWIGNLIVARDQRRNGIGSLLMQQCLDTLASSGVRSVWLTASASGAPLYERMGFRAIDRVVRWRLDKAVGSDGSAGFSGKDILDLVSRDRFGWGDDRSLLCREAVRQGNLVSGAGSSMVIRRMEAASFIGPWVADQSETAAALLDSVMGDNAADGSTFADVPEMNVYAATLFEKNGFKRCSSTVLMYLGVVPDYRADAIFALASPGSIG